MCYYLARSTFIVHLHSHYENNIWKLKRLLGHWLLWLFEQKCHWKSRVKSVDKRTKTKTKTTMKEGGDLIIFIHIHRRGPIGLVCTHHPQSSHTIRISRILNAEFHSKQVTVWRDWGLGDRHSSVVSFAPTILKPPGSHPKLTTYTFFTLCCWNWKCNSSSRDKINEVRIDPF